MMGLNRLIVAALALTLSLASRAAAGSVIFVDDNGLDCFGASYGRIAEAVAAAEPGARIVVCPGVYPEQVVVTKPLSIVGQRSGTRVPVIRPTALPESRPSLISGNPVTAAILVDTPKATIDGLDIELGANQVFGCSPVLTGIYFRNAAGAVRRNRIRGVRPAGRPECESGVAVYLETPVLADVTNLKKVKVATQLNTFIDYQKAGLVANGSLTLASIKDSEAYGSGLSSGPVQAGYQIAMGARARMLDTAAEAHASTLGVLIAPGVLVYGTQRVSIRKADVTNGQAGLFVVGGRVKFRSSEFRGLAGDGAILLGDKNTGSGNILDTLGISGVFLDGNRNTVRASSIMNTPVGYWERAGNGNQAFAVNYVSVPEEERIGGTRILSASAASPFTTFCRQDVDCDDANDCTFDTCALTTGACVHTPNVDGTPCDDRNECSVGDGCLAGTCRGAPAANGTPCDDAMFCTVTDQCTSGICSGADRSCEDGNECTLNTCDEGTDACLTLVMDDGTPCPDNNVCNGGETCRAGACTPGAPPSCNDGTSCTVDSCDPVAGCRHVPVANGTTCADANLCNGSEQCQAGLCVSDPSFNCSDGNSCTVDSCNPVTGCQHIAVPDGVSCVDANICNGTEVCQGGVCTTGVALACNDGNACTTDTCDPIRGCRFINATNGTPCADSTVCNGAETCQLGTCTTGPPLNCDDSNGCTTDTCNAVSGCVHTAIPNCTQCTTAADCNDSNPCTTDTCSGVGACQYTPVADGTSCVDTNICNGAETCSAGTCAPGTPLVCNDGNPCTTDQCNPSTGCQATPVTNGTSCADTNACNGGEVCLSGICAPGTPLVCNDGNPCTADSCDPASGCQAVAVADGTSCADGTVCNGAETCAAGVCNPGTALVCNDGNPCTADACDPVTGCVAPPVPDGTSCADGNACNGAETCAGGTCTPGTPPVCVDGNGCTADGCDPAIGCVFAPLSDGTSCADGDLCNGPETCLAGTCTLGIPLSCGDLNPCTADSCDPLTGCVNAPEPDGTSCSDSNACNGAEICAGGACGTGTPLICADGDPCTADACDPATGCVFPPEPDGTVCSDGNACNGTETCAGGVCTPNSPLVCDDGNPCTANLCDGLGGCMFPPLADGTSCADATVCNGDELCSGGTCTPGTPLVCNDGNPCTADGCDPGAGCVAPPLPDGTSCADTTVCNGDELCVGGTCTPGTPLVCNDGNPCTADGCDPGAGCVAPPLPDGTSCADATVCNGDELCSGGTCTPGTPLVCNDGNPCTADGCDPGTGCVAPPLPDGTSCADATVCNGDELCSGGTCTPGIPPVCDDSNECTTDTCDPVTGCANAPVSDGTPCGSGMMCSGGLCV